jgi:peptide methionine sulfoxide reductase MsrA
MKPQGCIWGIEDRYEDRRTGMIECTRTYLDICRNEDRYEDTRTQMKTHGYL